jgi:hypothetical protein
MKTCEYAGVPFAQARSHPWSDVSGNPDWRYYDLTASPEHIRRSLEDFRPWSRYAAIEDFYALLEWINQANSPFESSDCAFSAPEANLDRAIPKAFQCSGRVMLLFRALERNTAPGGIEQLKNRLHGELVQLDPRFEWGVIGTTLVPVRYLALADPDGQLGSQLMISFWAWGDNEANTMTNLRRSFKNLSSALHSLSALDELR